jgi:hypothetical protein
VTVSQNWGTGIDRREIALDEHEIISRQQLYDESTHQSSTLSSLVADTISIGVDVVDESHILVL